MRWKRALDVVLAVVVLVLVAVPLVVVAVAVRLDSRGPLLARHQRIGPDGRRFTLYKFRTTAASGHPQARTRAGVVVLDPRITRVGRHLRRLGFDELPQLVNVLRGDLSLLGAGPRPGRRARSGSPAPVAAWRSSRA